MNFFAFLLSCADGAYYVGHTDDLEQRVAHHVAGTPGSYTARRRPVELVWCEGFATREEALAAERRIKGLSRAKKEALIAGDWDRIGRLARNRQEHTRRQPRAASFDRLRTNGVGKKASRNGPLPTQIPVVPYPDELPRKRTDSYAGTLWNSSSADGSAIANLLSISQGLTRGDEYGARQCRALSYKAPA
jgi:putative endonuclease